MRTNTTFYATLKMRWYVRLTALVKISELNGPKLIFKEFTDGVHYLSGSINVEAAKNVNFNFVRVNLQCIEDDDIIKKDVIMDDFE